MELTEGNLRTLRRWARLFLAVAILTGFLGYFHQLYLRFNPAAERHYGRLVHVSIGGRDFAIPSEYFRGPLPHGTASQVYLWVMLPKYSPYSGELSSGANDLEYGWTHHLSIRINDIKYTTDARFRFNALMKGPGGRNHPELVASQYGLSRALVWKSTPRSSEPWIDSDVYYLASDREGSFIRCMPDSNGENVHPMCTDHVFQHGRLLFDIAYRKSSLPSWREIQDGVTNLVESFACSPGSASADGRLKPCPR